MSKEMWDLYSASGEKLGRQTVRGRNSLKMGEYHLVVHIWIVSSKGEFLIQRRADTKKLMPGEWAATGGAVISGEEPFDAARRELFEELGIKSDKNTLKKLLHLKRRNSLLDVFIITTDIKAENLTLQKSEVAEAKWVSKDTLRSMINNGKYHNYGNEYFNSVFKKIEEYRGITV